MWVSMMALSLVLAVTISQTVVNPPRTDDETETLTSAGEAVEAVLETASHPWCSVFLFTDGTTSTSSVLTMLDRLPASWGVAVFEVAVDGRDANMTQAQLSRVVDEARRLRQVSWCVTVVVVSDDPAFLAAFAEWSLKGRLLVWPTRLLVVTRRPLSELLNLNKSLSMMNAMLLVVDDATNTKRCSVYMHLPYSHRGAQAVQLASWIPHRGLTLSSHLQLFPNKFSPFIQRPTLVVTMQETVLTRAVMKSDPETPGDQRLSFTGLIPNLLQTVARSTNFSYRFSRPPDRTWGTRQPDGSWSGMVGVVSRGEADISPGPFAISASRAEVVDFTWPVSVSYSRIMAPRGRPEVDPWGFLLPLTPLVWTATMTALLVLSTTIFLLVTCLAQNNVNRTIWTVDVYGLIRVLLQQNISELSDWWWWERLVLAVWMLMTLVLTRSYAGNLMSLLAVRHISEPYKTLREVLDDPSVTMIWQDNSASVQYFRTTDHGIFREVGEAETAGRIRFLSLKEYGSVVAPLLRRGDHVLIEEETVIKMLMAQDFTYTGRCDFHTSREQYLTIMLSMITQKNSPLIPALHNRIMRVMEAGLFDQWLKEIIPNSTSCLHPPTKITVNTSLSIVSIWGMFMALSTGHVLGSLVFGFEFLSDRLSLVS
ncbi:probable glutamate receptor [Homarus americanus]|uniref:probable glutamate receptor n=1 Tax=Homarus americanus TaxID=6706 RepID=UPI001C46A67A|nr:probable glutamate receptor [Homarus americanus]